MNNFSSNSYCNAAKSAVINYRPYSAGKIRYRYPNENWQEIEGDDFTLDETCYGTYDVTVSYTMRICYFHRIRSQNTVTKRITGTILELRLERFPNATALYIAYKNRSGQEQRSAVWSTSSKLSEEECYTTNPSVRGKADYISKLASDYQIDDINLVDEGECSCVFNVLKCGESVYTEERKECPEVEIIQPQLLEEAEIVVNPISDNFYILVSNVGLQIDVRLSPPVGTINIPPNCLNIYLVNSFLSNSSVNTVHNKHPLQLIRQICSAKCSPPPQYEVICQEAEECPPGTCAVECNGHICCYDKNGISVFSFSK